MKLDIFSSNGLLETPGVVDIIKNMTEPERKELKKFTFKCIYIIVFAFLIQAVLFILFIKNTNISSTLKWTFFFSFLIFGFVASKIINYFMTEKQKRILESTEYARKNNIEL